MIFFIALIALLGGGGVKALVPEPLLLYTFPSSECESGVFTERTGNGPNMVREEAGTTCTTRAQGGDGVLVHDCSTDPNVLATSAPFGSVFDTYNINRVTNISVEIWFSVDASIPADEAYAFFLGEISPHDTHELRDINSYTSGMSMDPDDIHLSLAMWRVNGTLDDITYFLVDSPQFHVASLYSAGGFCEVFAVTWFSTEQSVNYTTQLSTIGSTTEKLYKLVFSGADAISTFFVGTSDGPTVEYSLGLSAVALFGVNPIRLFIHEDGKLRLGCSATSQENTPIVFYKVAIYNHTLSATQVDELFNSP